MAGMERQPAEQRVEQSLQLTNAEMAGCAAAQEECVHGLRLAERGDLGNQGVNVAVAQIIAANSNGEVAVRAAMGAKGDVDVSGARPDPGKRSGGHVFSLCTTE